MTNQDPIQWLPGLQGVCPDWDFNGFLQSFQSTAKLFPPNRKDRFFQITYLIRIPANLQILYFKQCHYVSQRFFFGTLLKKYLCLKACLSREFIMADNLTDTEFRKLKIRSALLHPFHHHCTVYSLRGMDHTLKYVEYVHKSMWYYINPLYTKF